MPAAAAPRGRADAIAAKEHSLRLRAQLKPGAAYKPTPLQAWRQAADDVGYNRPVKRQLVQLRNARADSDFSSFSFADTQLSEYEARIVANALRKAICAPVFRRPLRELDLRGCDIDVAKSAHLGRGLAGNVSIERLTLRNNPLTADGAELIVRGILESMRLVGDEQEYDAWGRRLRPAAAAATASGGGGSEAGGASGAGASTTTTTTRSSAGGAAPGPANARESASAGVHLILRAARPDLMDESGDSDGIVDGRRRAGHAEPVTLTQRDAALRQRQAQLSPYIAQRAEQLVTEVGHAPVTPSTPSGSMPVRGMTAGDMGLGALESARGRRAGSNNSGEEAQQAAAGDSAEEGDGGGAGASASETEGRFRGRGGGGGGRGGGGGGGRDGGGNDGGGGNDDDDADAADDPARDEFGRRALPAFARHHRGAVELPKAEAAAAHTARVFSTDMDPRSMRERARSRERAASAGGGGGGGGGATSGLAAHAQGLAVTKHELEAMRLKTGLDAHEVLGAELERRQAAALLGPLGSLSTEVGPTDSRAARRNNLARVDGMHGPTDAAPRPFYERQGLPPEPLGRLHAGGGEPDGDDATRGEGKGGEGAWDSEESGPSRRVARASGVGAAGAGVAGTAAPKRHPLRYLNLVSTLLTTSDRSAATALDLKQAGDSDSRGLDMLGELLRHPGCGLETLNVSKNRVDARVCERLWVALDHNVSLRVLGMHNTQAGPVAAAGFVAKALGLSLGHGRAALADTRLGGFSRTAFQRVGGINIAGMAEGDEAETNERGGAAAATTVGFLQGRSGGTGGGWAFKEQPAASGPPRLGPPPLRPPPKRPPPPPPEAPPPPPTGAAERKEREREGGGKRALVLRELYGEAREAFAPHISLLSATPSVFGGALDLSALSSSLASVAALGSALSASLAGQPNALRDGLRHGFEQLGPQPGGADAAVSPVFRERVAGVGKLNLSTCGLGDVGALAVAVLLMAAHRADEVLQGRLRQRTQLAAAAARRRRELHGGADKSFAAHAAATAGVAGGAGAMRRAAGARLQAGAGALDHWQRSVADSAAADAAAGDLLGGGAEASLSLSVASLASLRGGGSAGGSGLAAAKAAARARAAAAAAEAEALSKLAASLAHAAADPLLLAETGAAGGAFLGFAGGADEDAEARSVAFFEASGRPPLTWLKLRSNDIGPRAMHTLSRGVRLTRTLRTLDLSRNPLGSEGALALASALAHPHCALRELALDACHLTDGGREFGGAHALLRSLGVNRTLGRLSLRANTLVAQDMRFKRGWETQEITYSLRSVLGENRSLVELDLRDNRILRAGQIACAEAVAAFPFVVPHATEVAAVLTRWMDAQLQRHLRPAPGEPPATLRQANAQRSPQPRRAPRQRRRHHRHGANAGAAAASAAAAGGSESADSGSASASGSASGGGGGTGAVAGVGAGLAASRRRPHFPTIEELLARPLSSAPAASVFAALDAPQSVEAVAAAEARNNSVPLWKKPGYRRRRARGGGGADTDAAAGGGGGGEAATAAGAAALPAPGLLLQAVHLAAQAERHDLDAATGRRLVNAGAGSVGGATDAAAAAHELRREEREVAAIAAAVAEGRAGRHSDMVKVLAVGNLLAAARSGRGAAASALEFLAASEPAWMRTLEADKAALARRRREERARAEAAALAPPTPVAMVSATAASSAPSTAAGGDAGGEARAGGRGLMRLFGVGSNSGEGGGGGGAVASAGDSPTAAARAAAASAADPFADATSFPAPPVAAAGLRGLGGYPRVVLRGATDAAEGRALARLIRDSARRQADLASRGSQMAALALGGAAGGGGALRAVTPALAAALSSGAAAALGAASRLSAPGSRAASSGGAGLGALGGGFGAGEAALGAATAAPGLFGRPGSGLVLGGSGGLGGGSGQMSAARPATREALASQSVAAFLADGERPVADRDYVVVRGSRFAAEVALPKLDFTRLTQYGGIAPQNAFFRAQGGRDDVFLAHVGTLLRLGVPPPVPLPPEYQEYAVSREAHEALGGGVGGGGGGGGGPLLLPAGAGVFAAAAAAEKARAAAAAAAADGAGAGPSPAVGGDGGGGERPEERPASVLLAPRGLLRRQQSVREVLAATSKASRQNLGAGGEDSDAAVAEGPEDGDLDIDGFASLDIDVGAATGGSKSASSPSSKAKLRRSKSSGEPLDEGANREVGEARGSGDAAGAGGLRAQALQLPRSASEAQLYAERSAMRRAARRRAVQLRANPPSRPGEVGDRELRGVLRGEQLPSIRDMLLAEHDAVARARAARAAERAALEGRAEREGAAERARRKEESRLRQREVLRANFRRLMGRDPEGAEEEQKQERKAEAAAEAAEAAEDDVTAAPAGAGADATVAAALSFSEAVAVGVADAASPGRASPTLGRAPPTLGRASPTHGSASPTHERTLPTHERTSPTIHEEEEEEGRSDSSSGGGGSAGRRPAERAAAARAETPFLLAAARLAPPAPAAAAALALAERAASAGAASLASAGSPGSAASGGTASSAGRSAPSSPLGGARPTSQGGGAARPGSRSLREAALGMPSPAAAHGPPRADEDEFGPLPAERDLSSDEENWEGEEGGRTADARMWRPDLEAAAAAAALRMRPPSSPLAAPRLGEADSDGGGHGGNASGNGFVTASEHEEGTDGSPGKRSGGGGGDGRGGGGAGAGAAAAAIAAELTARRGQLPPRARRAAAAAPAVATTATAAARASEFISGPRARLAAMTAPKAKPEPAAADGAVSSDAAAGSGAPWSDSGDGFTSGGDGDTSGAAAARVPPPPPALRPPREGLVTADGGRRAVDSAGLVALDLSGVAGAAPSLLLHSESMLGNAGAAEVEAEAARISAARARRSRPRPGAYSRRDLALTTRKLLTPANAVPLLSLRRGEALRDVFATGVSSLVELRGAVLKRVFDFIGEERRILVVGEKEEGIFEKTHYKGPREK